MCYRMSPVLEHGIDSTCFVIDAAYRVNTGPNATKSCTECTPLLQSVRRPVRNGNRINNFALLPLGIILIGGIAIGGYLLAQDNRSLPANLVFDMVDRVVWDSNGFQVGPSLISSNVQNVYIMQTNGFHCHNFAECFAIVQSMQETAIHTQNSSLPYNFLIGGDGETYEIRGWSEQSGFSFVPKNSSLTIGIIGSFNKHPPPHCQLTETFALILESLRRRKIVENYQIYGYRNATMSANNSEAMLKAISVWDHWNATVEL